MSEPIDFFAPNLELAPDHLRKAVARAVEDTLLDHETQDRLLAEAWHPETTTKQCEGLLSYCEQHRRSARDYFAPSQRMISAHIKRICGL